MVLLWCSSAVNVLANIGNIMELSRSALNTVPNLSGRRRSRLSTNKAVDSCLQSSELILYKGALSESCTEEGSVDGHQDPGTPAECNGGQQEAGPEEDLEICDKPHRCIIVFLDELANSVCHRVGFHGWLGAWGCAGGRCNLLRRIPRRERHPPFRTAPIVGRRVLVRATGSFDLANRSFVLAEGSLVIADGPLVLATYRRVLARGLLARIDGPFVPAAGL